ncbi:MAG: hypothetical protein J0H29_21745 [Sphingobacteriales bacterium]|nr:hypothetical protein [Sphingobacteriales bacterium]OJY80905.1 MAG: hypothetical protein BGP14_01570 [Sphingobacteriales bacterium 44-15]
MKNANLIMVLLCYATLPSNAQNARQPVVTWYASSGAYSKDFSDAFTVYTNPASLAGTDHFSAGVYGEQRFMLTETGNYAAVIAIPSASGNFALTAEYFGYKAYNETTLGIGYGRKIGEQVYIGARFNYYSVLIQSYGKASTLNAEAGSLFQLTPQLWSGFSVANLFPGRLGKQTGEKLARVYKAGIGYTLSQLCFFGATVIKEENSVPSAHFSIQYRPIRQLFARAGILTGNHSWYAGLGYLWKNLRMDITASFHDRLGMSPGLLLLYEAPQTETE